MVFTIYVYCVFVQQTLERILTNISIPQMNDFSLVFKIADGLNGSGSHVIYSREKTNTATKNFSFVLNQFQFVQILFRYCGKTISPILYSVKGQYSSVLRNRMKQTFEI